MKKWGRREKLYLASFLLIIAVCLFVFPIKAENSENSSSSEWWMFHKYLNHTGWDGVPFTVVGGLNAVYFTAGGQFQGSSPAVAYGYVYIGSDDKKLYQLNASNVSIQIATFTTGEFIRSSPAVANGYVYVGSNDDRLYQLNASNISVQFANFTAQYDITSSPAVANGYVYVGSNDDRLYQLNASNVSIQIANFTTGDNVYISSSAVANGYIYVGSVDKRIYQLNASNVSKQIANFTTGGAIYSSPAVANGYIYVGSADNKTYQLNASNISIQFANFTANGTVSSSPAVANGYIYVGSSNNFLYQLNASNISQQIASYASLFPGVIYTSGMYSSPAIANGYVYIGSEDEMMYQLNASNVSNLYANFSTTGNVWTSPAIANGYVYAGNAESRMYQLNASNISLVCFETWSCSDWSSCVGGSHSRTCSDLNSCGTELLKPALSEGCTASSGGGWYINQTTQTNVTATETQSVGAITSGRPASFGITDPNLNIRNVTINTNTNVSNVSLTVSRKANQSLPLTFPSGLLYQAFKINTTVSNDHLNNVTLDFRVSKTWLSQQNYTYNDVLLYRIPDQDSLWQALATKSIREDNDYYYFTSLSPGFSTFIIFVGITECTAQQTRCFNNILQSCAENRSWTVEQACTYACQNSKCINSIFGINPSIIYAGLVCGITIALLIVLFLTKIKFSKRKSLRNAASKFNNNNNQSSLNKPPY